MTLHTQFVAMGAMIAGGMYLGMANETFRRFAPYLHRSIVLMYFAEIAFWLMQTMLLYYVLFRINYGELRFYLFIALIFGFLCYQQFLRKIYIAILNVCITIIKNIFLTLYKLTIVPILYITNLIVQIVRFFLRTLYRVLRWIVQLVLIRPIKWLLPKKVHDFISKSITTYSTMVVTIFLKMKAFFSKWRR